MTGRALLFFVIGCSGCSVLFDPARVPASGCPTSAERCSAPANAVAVCQASACGFECVEGFRDADGLAENGCEASCAAPASPASLSVTSGTDGTSLSWAFTPVTDAPSYRLCTGVAAGTPTCVTVPSSACAAGRCVAQTTGHPLKAQISGQVQALNSCQAASSETRATGFTIRTTEVLPWSSDSNCAPMASVAGEVLSVEQPVLCVGSATFGDEQWRSGTFEVELRPTGALGANVMAGFVFVSGTRRLSLLFGPNSVPVAEGTTVLRESRSNGPWRMLASAGATLAPDEWNRVRVVLDAGRWSVSVGRGMQPLREVLRYHDGASTSEAWRLGLHSWTPNLFSAGRVELRNLSVSTESTLPMTGPTAQSWSFDATAGAQPPVRTFGAAGTVLRYEPCPAFPPAPACTPSTGCAPDAGTCARIAKGAFTGGALTFEVPTGLDTQRPWSLRLRFAGAADGGFAGGSIAYGPSGTLIEPENAWDGGARGLGGRWGLPLSADTWNLVEYRFDPVSSTVTARLNGQQSQGATRFPPALWDKHVGAVSVGSQGLSVVDLWLSDVFIGQ